MIFWPAGHDILQVSQQPNRLVLASCPQAYGCISPWLFVNYCCPDILVLCCSRVSFHKTEEAPMAAVCLQPPSVDLWLQVPIMAANFKGLVGSVPTTACCCPCGPLCVRVHNKRDKVSSRVISRLACVCTSMCVCVCMFLPQVGLMGIRGGCEKPKRRFTVGKPLSGEETGIKAGQRWLPL